MISARQAEKGKEEYLCPACQEKVILKQGSLVSPHFAHQKHSDCHSFSEGESQEHLQGKKVLFKTLKKHYSEVSLEPYISQLQQRPDLMVKNERGDYQAIEFQCSPISIDKMIQRSQGYTKEGIEVIWILGQNFQLKETNYSHLLSYARHYQNKFPYLLRLHAQAGKLEILSHFSKSYSQKLSYYQTVLKLDQSEQLKQVFQSLSKLSPQKARPKIKEKHQRLQQQSYNMKSRVVAALRSIYQEGHNLHSLPLEVYTESAYDWLIDSPDFQWRFFYLMVLAQYDVHDIFSLADLEDIYLDLSRQGQLEFLRTPFLGDWLTYFPLYDFIEDLERSQILAAIDTDLYRLESLPTFFSHPAEKVEALNP